MSVLEIRDLHVTVETDAGHHARSSTASTSSINEGETHAIMGPNGSGKSTLAYTIAGHPKYKVARARSSLDGEDVLAMTVDERARAGLFLAMQYPVEIPGVTVTNFLRTAKTAIDGEAPSIRTWTKDVKQSMKNLRMDSEVRPAQRQRGLLRRREEAPRDPAARAAEAADSPCSTRPTPASTSTRSRSCPRASTAPRTNTDLGVLLITHYTRILRYIHPDFVHVIVAGRIVEEGGPELADRLEDEGYDRYHRAARSKPRPRAKRRIAAMTATLAPEKYDEVTEALKDVMDPELGINVVDLGLIYDLGWDDENDALVIHMTLTSAGCPLTDVLEEQTAQALDGVVDAFRINWVWMPPWGPERITDDGRDMMRALGFAI